MSRLPDYAEAQERALSCVEALSQVDAVALESAGGRVLVESVVADRDLPPFNRAMMDGYAIRAADFSPDKSWQVAHVIAAGSTPEVRVPPSQCVAIATGAALPRDVDTVIPHEQSDRGDHHGQPVKFTIKSTAAGNAVHLRGSDAKTGDELIAVGTRLGPQHLGIAAAVGLTKLHVATPPRTIILTSGDEVVPADTPTASLAGHHVRNSNAVMIAELVQRMGGDVLQSHHLPDDREVTILAVRDAVQQADLVITIGGVSAGDREGRLRLVIGLEPADELDRRAVEGIDVLVIVTHRKEIELALRVVQRPARDCRDELVLVSGDILVFVDEDPAKAGEQALALFVGFLKRQAGTFEQRHGLGNHGF
jgi:molybdopterin molybdotransferase